MRIPDGLARAGTDKLLQLLSQVRSEIRPCVALMASKAEASFCAEPYMHGTVGCGPCPAIHVHVPRGGITPAWTHHS